MSETPPRRASAQLSLFDGDGPGAPAIAGPSAPDPDPDAAARAFAVDPRHNVVLEASAGTGKTSVLVARYVNLLKAGVDPSNILAITFTRKAAAEMRERIIRELRAAAGRSEFDRTRWLDLRDRLAEIAISTIDAFCLSLLREFPLEADVDPGFDLADETEVPRLMSAALDRTLRILVGRARSDPDMNLVLAQLGVARTRDGLATLLERRLVARDALDRFLAHGPQNLTAGTVCRSAAGALHETLRTVDGGLPQFLGDGPAGHPRYELFRREVHSLAAITAAADTPEGKTRAVLERVAAHFLTHEGKARRPGGVIAPYRADHYASKEAMKRHRDAVFEIAPRVERVLFEFNRDLNVVLARGIGQMFGIALEQYRRALDERSVLDFSDVLQRAVALLRHMDEFSQSRYRLESRYHHVLVDEFQDTSRAQWELISLLVEAWGEGLGLASNPSIFIVGDRKQSIYRFRDAEVAVLRQAAEYIDGLRPGAGARRSIARSFRAAPELLHFVNDLFAEISQPAQHPGEFTYEEKDHFPTDVTLSEAPRHEPALGLAVADTPDACAAVVADEIVQLLRGGAVRDKATGARRPLKPGDVGILFRSRSSHREFERELGARGIPTYVYKGLGFFDADEIKDLTALLRYLADPTSHLRAAAFLRSRFVRLSDRALAALAPDVASALRPGGAIPPGTIGGTIEEEDRTVLAYAREHVGRWLALADRITPAELLDRILAESAYAYELRGPRQRQSWENVKKMRALVRRMQNRGYATLPRIAEHLLSLSAGDESNAIVEALDAVNLMTVHASKGLEFPVVFVVNLTKGASAPPRPVRVIVDGYGGPDEASVSIGPFLSDTDEAERERERHETRRLLYVAITRARERLYLASTLKDGAFVPGRGSLAEVLPESFRTFVGRASAALDGMENLGWTGVSGREYVWRLCRGAGASAPDVPSAADEQVPASCFTSARPAGADDFGSVAEHEEVRRLAVSEWVSVPADPGESPEGARSDRLLGVLVHRLFASAPVWGDEADAALALSRAERLLLPAEAASIENPDGLARRAADAWLRARARPDVVDALGGARRSYEVPFSMRVVEGSVERLLRGTIDCVVRKGDGHVVVVEFKTGRPRAAHERQLDVYVEAVRRMRLDEGVAFSPSPQEGDAVRAPAAAASVSGILVYV